MKHRYSNDLIDGHRLEMDAYLTRPIDPDALHGRLSQVLAARL